MRRGCVTKKSAIDSWWMSVARLRDKKIGDRFVVKVQSRRRGCVTKGKIGDRFVVKVQTAKLASKIRAAIIQRRVGCVTKKKFLVERKNFFRRRMSAIQFRRCNSTELACRNVVVVTNWRMPCLCPSSDPSQGSKWWIWLFPIYWLECDSFE